MVVKVTHLRFYTQAVLLKKSGFQYIAYKFEQCMDRITTQVKINVCPQCHSVTSSHVTHCDIQGNCHICLQPVHHTLEPTVQDYTLTGFVCSALLSNGKGGAFVNSSLSLFSLSTHFCYITTRISTKCVFRIVVSHRNFMVTIHVASKREPFT